MKLIFIINKLIVISKLLRVRIQYRLLIEGVIKMRLKKKVFKAMVNIEEHLLIII